MKIKRMFMILLVITLFTLLGTGCEYKTLKKEDIKKESANASFETVKSNVEKEIKDLKLDENELVESCDVSTDEEKCSISITLTKSATDTLIEYSDSQDIQNTWKVVKDSYQEIVDTAQNYFKDAGYNTKVEIMVINGYNDEKIILWIDKDGVQYDLLNEK